MNTQIVQQGKSFFLTDQYPTLQGGIRRWIMNFGSRTPLQTQLMDFIETAKNQRVHRAWLESDEMKVYVRKAQRLIEGKQVVTLDIASVEVKPEKRSQGVFTRFLNLAHDVNPWDATFVENASTDRFANYFWRRDWELYDEFSRCFYKKKNQGPLHDAWTRQREKLPAD